MEWRGRRQSRNTVDRGSRRGGAMRVGGVGGVGAIVVVLVGLFLGVDLTPLLQGGGGAVTQAPAPSEMTPEEQERREFVSVVLADTEDAWAAIFAEQVDGAYPAPTLAFFQGGVDTRCGSAGSEVGPFYCPADATVYLDTSFFVVMSRQLGASGDFAEAYVVAHEVGHHVQNVLGILAEKNAERAQVSEAASNAISVRIELQADCLAGISARFAERALRVLNPGDIEEAVRAAQAIGDDTLQRRAGQQPSPHSFTHGTSAQRARWFVRGYETGQIRACDTFATDRL